MLSTAIEATLSLPVLPFRCIETNWFVISGVFSSGKTTLISDLAAARPELAIVPDVARLVIEKGLAWRGMKGESVELTSILGTQKFEDTVFAGKWERHVECEPTKATLFDYGLPDVVAFTRACGLSTNTFAERVGLFRYRGVFILEPLPYQKDEAREWTPEQRAEIQRNITSAYAENGFQPILVPAMSRPERRDFVLEQMARLNA